MKRARKIKIMILCGVLLVTLAAYLAYWPGYILHAVWEETKILLKKRKVTEVVIDKNIPLETRNKLALAQEAKNFAKKELGLATDNLYEYYSEINDTLAFVVSASPRNKLVNKTWWFPIVGSVPYLGFFDEKKARHVTKELEERGFDTYLRPTSAFSTLGWLPDPILSTMLKADSLLVVETIIHESTHPTVWVRGNTQFNESLAKFVGIVGAKEFFCKRPSDAVWCQKAQANLEDALLISDFFNTLHDSLSSIYEENQIPDLVLKNRGVLLYNFNSHFQKDIKPLLKSDRYLKMDVTKLNNASFLARYTYYHRLRTFYNAYKKMDGVSIFLKKLLLTIPKHDNPWNAVDNI